MKFVADQKNSDRPSPVAYIDHYGDLVFYSLFHNSGVSIDPFDGQSEVNVDFKPLDERNHQVFYPGDKLTIEF